MESTLILAVGKDPAVLNSRCAILRSAGYVVRPASSIAESIRLLQSDDFDLVLLCHSVPIEDRDRLTRLIRTAGWFMPVYSVAPGSGYLEAGLADGILSSRPAELIKELESAMRLPS